jgi:hypothetical protein
MIYNINLKKLIFLKNKINNLKNILIKIINLKNISLKFKVVSISLLNKIKD